MSATVFVSLATIPAMVTLLLLQASSSSALTFGIIGDVGLGGIKYAVNDEIRSTRGYNDACGELGGCNFTIIVGDNMYCPNVMECLEVSFETAFNSDGPFFPSVGNHDNWGPQVTYTTAKENAKKRWHFPNRWYTVKLPIDDTGYSVQIFAVDTTEGSLGGGGQYAWLEASLQQSDARWKIIFGHYPTVGSGKHKRVGSVNRIHDLMKKYNAQAFFAGHDHIVEMNNLEGRMLGIAGGHVRGGMMWRAVGGVFRRFTLTAPSEYKAYTQDWPLHGYMTAQLSPNVLTVQIWDNLGGIAYETTTTWNWMTTLVASQPKALVNQFPPAEVVRAAYEEEKTLARGPGGGTIFGPNGQRFNQSVNPLFVGATTAPPTTTAATVSGQTSTTTTTTTTTPAQLNVKLDGPAVDDRTLYDAKMNVDLGFAVSTECFQGLGQWSQRPCLPNGLGPAYRAQEPLPTAGIPFTVFINGITLDSNSRVFLSQSMLGCGAYRDKPVLVPGTTIRASAASNTISFNATTATNAYVCLSTDGGKSYVRLDRIDALVVSHSFVIIARSDQSSDGTTAPERSRESQVSRPATEPPTMPPKSASNAGTVAMMVIVFVAAGALLWLNRHRRPHVATGSRGGDAQRTSVEHDEDEENTR